MGEALQVGVAAGLERQDGRACAPGVLHSRQQLGWCCSGSDHEDGFARPRVVDPAQVDRQVRRGSGRHMVADEDGRQLRQPAQARFLVQMGDKMPGLVSRCADDQQAGVVAPGCRGAPWPAGGCRRSNRRLTATGERARPDQRSPTRPWRIRPTPSPSTGGGETQTSPLCGSHAYSQRAGRADE